VTRPFSARQNGRYQMRSHNRTAEHPQRSTLRDSLDQLSARAALNLRQANYGLIRGEFRNWQRSSRAMVFHCPVDPFLPFTITHC
jgi:type VI protein secretion system component VasF